jgi:malate/lactate dehydrogenase
MPVILGENGIAGVVPLTLNQSEKAFFEESIGVVQNTKRFLSNHE